MPCDAILLGQLFLPLLHSNSSRLLVAVTGGWMGHQQSCGDVYWLYHSLKLRNQQLLDDAELLLAGGCCWRGPLLHVAGLAGPLEYWCDRADNYCSAGRLKCGGESSAVNKFVQLNRKPLQHAETPTRAD